MKINEIYEIVSGTKGMDILMSQDRFFMRYHHVHYSCHVNEGLGSILKETAASGKHHFYLCKQLDPAITIRIPTIVEIVKYLELESCLDLSGYIYIGETYENGNVKTINVRHRFIDCYVGVGSDGNFYTIDEVQNSHGAIDCNSYITNEDLSDDIWGKVSNLEELILSTYGNWRYVSSDEWYADETTNTIIGKAADPLRDSCRYYKYIKLYNERSIEFKILSSSAVAFENVKAVTSNLSKAFYENRIADGYTFLLHVSNQPELAYVEMEGETRLYTWKDALIYFATKKEHPERFAALVSIIEKSEKDFDEEISRLAKSKKLSLNEKLRIMKEAKERRNNIYTYTMK